jgi:hypothetical protein
VIERSLAHPTRTVFVDQRLLEEIAQLTGIGYPTRGRACWRSTALYPLEMGSLHRQKATGYMLACRSGAGGVGSRSKYISKRVAKWLDEISPRARKLPLGPVLTHKHPRG